MTGNTAETPAANMQKLCMTLYGLYAAGMLMQFTFTTMVIGTIAITAAIIITYAKRGAAKGTVYESHIQWLYRTFWIGGAVFLPVMTVIAAIAMFFLIDLSDVQNAIQSGEVADTATMVSKVVEKNMRVILGASVVCVLPVMGWWLWRCWEGFALLKAGKPIPNATRWF